MITLKLQDNTQKRFNLKNFKTEKRLYNAWFSIQGEKKFENKKLKITTDKNEQLLLKILEIKDCKVENCIYFSDPEVKTKEEKVKTKEKEKPRKDNFMDQLNKTSQEREEKNIKRFFLELKKRNVVINFNDLDLQRVIESVKQDITGTKIPFYANLYTNLKRK